MNDLIGKLVIITPMYSTSSVHIVKIERILNDFIYYGPYNIITSYANKLSKSHKYPSGGGIYIKDIANMRLWI